MHPSDFPKCFHFPAFPTETQAKETVTAWEIETRVSFLEFRFTECVARILSGVKTARKNEKVLPVRPRPNHEHGIESIGLPTDWVA